MWFVVAMVVGLLLRLLLAWHFYGSSDVRAWEYFSDYFANGKSPYDSPKYNYTPVWFWVITCMSKAAQVFGVKFSFAIKLPLILADGLMAAVLMHLGRRAGFGIIPATIFILNPVSIIITGVHGQFDNLSLLFCLLACAASLKGPQQASWKTLVALSAAVCVKHFNVLFVPVFAFYKKTIRSRGIYLAFPAVAFVAIFMPYLKDWRGIVSHVLSYNLHGGYWGWSGILVRSWLALTGQDLALAPWFGAIDYFNLILYGIIFAASIQWARRYDALDSVIGILLLFYALSTQMAPQYTVWILPFASLRPNKWLVLYTLFGTIQVASFLYCHFHWKAGIEMTGFWQSKMSELFVLSRHLTWLVVVCWLFSHLIRRRAASSRA